MSNVVVGDGQADWHLIHEAATLRKPSRLGQYWQKPLLDVFNNYSNTAWKQCILEVTPKISYSTVQNLRTTMALSRHSLTQPFPYTRAHSSEKKQKNKEQNAQLIKHDAFVYWSSSCPVWWWATARKLNTCSSWLPHVGGLLAVLGQYWQKTFVDVFNKYCNIARQQSPF